MSFLCSWGAGLSCTPSGLFLGAASCAQTSDAFFPKSEGPGARPARASNRPVSFSFPLQDCENYITLLERQGEGLLVCGTNARRPSCWNLVRRPLPMCLQLTLVWGGLLPLMVGRRWGNFEADFTLYRVPGRMGTLAGKLAPRGGSGHGIMWLSDPLGLSQVNGTVESLGERRGYAPFSPDENSLVLFDGRAVTGAPEGCCPSLGEGGQLRVPWPRPWGGTSRSYLLLPMPLPPYPGDEVYSTIRKQEYNGKIPRFRRIQGEIELYTSDTVMQSESGSAGLRWTKECECAGRQMRS